MSEVLTESIQWLNLPFTVLLGMVLLYWCLVMLGVVDIHLFGDTDVDVHAEVDGDVHAEVDGDGHFEPSAHLDGGAHPLHGDKDGALGSGFLIHALSFLNIGRVPLMLVVSVLSLCLWLGSIIANHYFTGGSATLALAALVPNFVLSVIATRYITMPFRPVFRMLNRDREDQIQVVGQHCTIVTSEATPEFGQAEIKTNGAPLLLNVRTINDERCVRGEVAVVVRHDAERSIHFIAPLPKTHPTH
jgi:hypothetical protein